ncbi:NAD(P)H-binding protein [Spongisporangium articulatum]|uniref:NAD(P)H-binding protein n=1 Tax=Spongisporangium articulatum TaxID=3362603 RepID=A0ABW8AIF7_9ACTN
MRVVVLGATGYIGSRLVPELLARGHDVVATGSGRPRRLLYPWSDRVEWRRVQARSRHDVHAALKGADAAVYLVHGLSGRAFAAADREAARVVRNVGRELGLPRLVYLSGLVPDVPEEQLSEHIRSRLEVEEVLAGGPVSTLTLRAGIVLGAGSTSFEILRQVAAVNVVQWLPPSMRSRVQPISVADAVAELAGAVEDDGVTGHLDIGGPDVLTYADLLATYARVAGLRRVQLPAPPVPNALVAAVSPLTTAAPWWTVMSLVQSLTHDMVCDPGRSDPLAPANPLGVETAIRRALREPYTPFEGTEVGGDPHVLAPSDPGWARPSRLERLLPPAAVPAGRLLGGVGHIAEYRLRGLVGL